MTPWASSGAEAELGADLHGVLLHSGRLAQHLWVSNRIVHPKGFRPMTSTALSIHALQMAKRELIEHLVHCRINCIVGRRSIVVAKTGRVSMVMLAHHVLCTA